MGTSVAWAKLQAALHLINEWAHPEPEEKETTPEQVAALMSDGASADDDAQQQKRFAAGATPTPVTTPAPASGGDTFRDASGRALSAAQASAMRDSKGRPIVIPRGPVQWSK